MDSYRHRKIKFKAWNTQTRLLMKLDSIECRQGELIKPDHILLQYTGCRDKHLQEIYEMDIVLNDTEKFRIEWSDNENAWMMESLVAGAGRRHLTQDYASAVVRLRSYFESEGNL